MSLTQREFLFLDDLLHLEELEVKSCLDFAQHATDPQIKQMFVSLARQHQQHFDRLLNFLGQAQQPSYQQTSFASSPSTSFNYGQAAYASPAGTYYSGTAGSPSAQYKQ